MPPHRPRILFVCVQNAGRSQMAAAFARTLGRGRVEVFSAGSAPARAVHAEVVAVMAEVGIDLTRERPKLLEVGTVTASDAVVTMGCGDACPVFPGKRYEDWRVPDPSGQPRERVREIRDELARRVTALLAALGVAVDGPSHAAGADATP